MNREELIEEARRAYLDAWAATNLEDVPPGTRSRNGITAALAVFEKAHAPADDEREALVDALCEEGFVGSGYEIGTHETVIFVEHVPDVVARLGFHRSEVPEPQGDDRTHEFANMAAIMGIPEPQGEPSDAQVEAAARCMFGATVDSMSRARELARTALRAAGVVR